MPKNIEDRLSLHPTALSVADRERLKGVLNNKLKAVGWHKAVREELMNLTPLCATRRIDSKTMADLLFSRARAMIPQSIRQEMLDEVHKVM